MEREPIELDLPQEPDPVCFQAEQSLRKRFKPDITSPFTRALKEYRLVNAGDCVAVCISGGKDSTLLAKLFQELKRYSEVPFEVRYLVMDPGYAPENRALIEENLRKLQIPAVIFETDIFESVYGIENSPCYLCARMRRGYLYHFARRLGCNKIALGHHFDDVIETNLMSMLYGGQIQTMMPKLHSANFPGMELIRPLYFVREAKIERWRDANGLRFLQCACRFTAHVAEERKESKRQEAKRLIQQLKKTTPDVEQHIFHSMENVALDAVLGYKQKGKTHSFLERYEEEKNEN